MLNAVCETTEGPGLFLCKALQSSLKSLSELIAIVSSVFSNKKKWLIKLDVQ